MFSSLCDVSGSVTMATSNLNGNDTLARSRHNKIVRVIVPCTQDCDTGKSSKHLPFGYSIDNAEIYFPYLDTTAVKSTV